MSSASLDSKSQNTIIVKKTTNEELREVAFNYHHAKAKKIVSSLKEKAMIAAKKGEFYVRLENDLCIKPTGLELTVRKIFDDEKININHYHNKNNTFFIKSLNWSCPDN